MAPVPWTRISRCGWTGCLSGADWSRALSATSQPTAPPRLRGRRSYNSLSFWIVCTNLISFIFVNIACFLIPQIVLFYLIKVIILRWFFSAFSSITVVTAATKYLFSSPHDIFHAQLCIGTISLFLTQDGARQWQVKCFAHGIFNTRIPFFSPVNPTPITPQLHPFTQKSRPIPPLHWLFQYHAPSIDFLINRTHSLPLVLSSFE